MILRKFSAAKVFDGFRLHETAKVLITDAAGTVLDLVEPAEAGDDVQQLDGILSPGFINCHCHMELSHMEGLIAEKTGLVDFVMEVMTKRHLTEEIVLEAIEKAETAMLDNGIVAVGDICNNALTIRQKMKGRIWYHNFIEASGFNPEMAQQRFEQSTGYFAAYAQLYSIPVASNSIVPHAPYSVSTALWEKIVNFPGNQLLTVHNQETEAENQLYISGDGDFLRLYEKLKLDAAQFNATGKSSLQSWYDRFLPNQTVILVHNVETGTGDIAFTKMKGHAKAYWCLCPKANRYISDKMPPVELLMNENCEIVLGTDSLASNNSLSILDEIKTLKDEFPKIPLEQLLMWGTSNGAKALQVDALLGSFTKGLKPGVLEINGDLEKVVRVL